MNKPSNLRQEAGLYSIAEAARTCGITIPVFHYHLELGDIARPTHEFAVGKYRYYEGGKRRYYSEKEVQEISARLAMIRELRAKLKAVRSA